MRATDERARDSRNRQSEILVSRLTKKLKLSSTKETSSPYASRLQVYSKIQDCMNFLLNMRAYSEFRCHLIFLKIVLYFQSGLE